MTNKTIAIYYKWLSLITLILSILGTITLVDGDAMEWLGIGLLINLQFHLAYQFLSRVPFAMYGIFQDENTWKRRTVTKVLTAFSFIVMFGAVMGLIGMVKSAIANHEYSQLIVTMTFSAVFLGGLSLNLQLRNI